MQKCAIHQLVVFAVHTYVNGTRVSGKGWIDKPQTLRMFQNLLKLGIQTATKMSFVSVCFVKMWNNVRRWITYKCNSVVSVAFRLASTYAQAAEIIVDPFWNATMLFCYLTDPSHSKSIQVTTGSMCANIFRMGQRSRPMFRWSSPTEDTESTGLWEANSVYEWKERPAASGLGAAVWATKMTDCRPHA